MGGAWGPGTPGGSFRAGCEGAIADAEEGSLHTLVPEDRPAVSPLSDPGALSETEGGKVFKVL